MSNKNNHLDDETRQYFQTILEQEKNDILSKNERTRDDLQNERIPTADINDRASQEEEFAFQLRIRNREALLLRKIDNALKRLKLNTYGWCEQCGEAISIARLKSRPTSELCIHCKEKAENHERRYRD